MMKPDKPLEAKLPNSLDISYNEAPSSWLEEEEAPDLTEQHSLIRTIISRATVVYLVLFLALGGLMSSLGVNPLARGGLMPKALFLFVGAALVMALVNVLTEAAREHGQGWLSLMCHLTRRKRSPRSGER
jgi:hypothetical protein